MSEHYLYVACNCFRDGLTTDPPISREKLNLDRFGNVKRAVDRSAEDSPEGLWDWRNEQACEHDEMRLVDEIYDGPRPQWSHPLVERVTAGAGYESLRELLHRDVTGGASVFATSAEAESALPELQRLLEMPTGIAARVLTDPRGRISGAIDRDGYGGRTDFVQLGMPGEYPSSRIEGVDELGLEGLEFVLRDCGSGRERFRSTTLQVFQTDQDAVHIGGASLRHTLFLPGEGAHPCWSLTPRLSLMSGYPTQSRAEPYVPEVFTVEVREQPMIELDHRLSAFDDVLAASAESGNPLVSYYSGCSLGFD